MAASSSARWISRRGGPLPEKKEGGRGSFPSHGDDEHRDDEGGFPDADPDDDEEGDEGDREWDAWDGEEDDEEGDEDEGGILSGLIDIDDPEDPRILDQI